MGKEFTIHQLEFMEAATGEEMVWCDVDDTWHITIGGLEFVEITPYYRRYEDSEWKLITKEDK